MNWWEKYTPEELAEEMSRRRRGKKWKDMSKHKGFQNRPKEEIRKAAYKGLAKRYDKKVEDYGND